MGDGVIDNPINNPVPGDLLVNRKDERHKTRLVLDRTLGGSVVYCYHRGRYGCQATCALTEWFVFAEHAKVIGTGVRPNRFYPPPKPT